MWLKISSVSAITLCSAHRAAISGSWPTVMPLGRWGELMMIILVLGVIRLSSESRSKWKSGSTRGA